MLASEKIMAFVPARDLKRARAFYETILGLRLVSEDPSALVLDANGITLRVAKVEALQPRPFTILGWQVTDIAQTVSKLQERSVAFERYAGMPQDNLGIWKAPSGARVAWFKDPDGNVLSVTQFD